MTYAKYKQQAAQLDISVSEASKALKQFPRGAMGLTPDAVKATPEWKIAKQRYDLAFHCSRKFNSWFTKAYKKELAAERNERRAALQLKHASI